MRPRHIPINEVLFTAKTGFLTRSIWQTHFNRHQRSWSTEKWQNLVKRNIFKVYGRNKDLSILILNRRSPLVRQLVKNDLSYPPNPYQIDHDECVINFVLSLKSSGKVSNYFFEPELKQDPDRFQLRKSKKYPDAIVTRGTEQFAIEVELSRKAGKRYRKIFDYYRSMDCIDSIVFVCGSDKIKAHIERALHESKFPILEKPVEFHTLKTG